MNETVSYEFERLSQTLVDLNSLIPEEIHLPKEILYYNGTLNFKNHVDFRTFDKDERWGGFDKNGWFRINYTVPKHLDEKEIWMELAIDKNDWYAQNPQFLVYVNGKAVQGIDINHMECPICQVAKAGEEIVIDLDAWSGMVIRGRTWSDKENAPSIFKVRFYTKNKELNELYYDIKVPYDIARLLGYENKDSLAIMEELTRAVNMLDLRKPGSKEFNDSVIKVKNILNKHLYEEKCGFNEPKAMCVGHTHIDVAWMWKFIHTKRKAMRSFSTVLKLLEEYPEYIFMSSQPQLYEFIEEQSEEVFEKIKKLVKEGRWETEGGMWVEADCNLTSGESLIRQFIYGKAYFKNKFNKDNKILWLPDVFGYSAALPQICKKCGIDYFMTTKISWNEQNMIPYDTFMWKGIDGTELLTHFSPSKPYNKTDYNPFGFARTPYITTYNAELNPDHIMGGWKRYRQKKLNKTFLVEYGYGDGGGGTTREMIENGIRMAKGIPGCPKVEFSSSRKFFETIENEVKENKNLPTWYGELYLEFHRGTYTSVGKVKRDNRKAEIMLQVCEFFNSLALRLGIEETYPKEMLNNIWKKVLTNQFHDILPGSSIDGVYEDCDKIYKEVFEKLTKNISDVSNKIAQNIYSTGDSLVIFNTIGFDRDGIAEFKYNSNSQLLKLTDFNGKSYYAQKTFKGTYIAKISSVPGAGYIMLAIEEINKNISSIQWDGKTIDNGIFNITINSDGTLSSIYDTVQEREVLNGNGNILETYEDRPYQYDAWEISPYYREKKWILNHETEIKVIEQGPVRICLEFTYKYLNSIIVQKVFVYQNSRRIDFVTDVDWKEEHILLKAAFPVDIVSQKATYEIQFGAVERPTHTNTSWDTAKFESCAQRWADVSEPNYGVSLLNDSKYGYDIHDNIIRLTLLRSPTFPNSQDIGKHHFTYSLYPYIGSWQKAMVTKEAYDLNTGFYSTVIGKTDSKLSNIYSFINCNTPGIIIETIKQEEDGDNIIVRAYESFGNRTKASFKLDNKYSIWECNMLEQEEKEVCHEEEEFTIEFKPFEIKTFKMMQK